jgi:hypothetical protein
MLELMRNDEVEQVIDGMTAEISKLDEYKQLLHGKDGLNEIKRLHGLIATAQSLLASVRGNLILKYEVRLGYNGEYLRDEWARFKEALLLRSDPLDTDLSVSGGKESAR